MKKLLAILSLAIISAPAFAVNFHANAKAFEHAKIHSVPEPGILSLFALAGVIALLFKLKK